MKKLSYILLFCYALALFRPLVPAIADGIAHAFWKMEHMATVHYENGSFHVHKEIKEAAGDEDPSKTNKRAAADQGAASHLAPQHSEILAPVIFPPPCWTVASEKIPSRISLQIPTPPPWQG